MFIYTVSTIIDAGIFSIIIFCFGIIYLGQWLDERKRKKNSEKQNANPDRQ